MKTLGALVAWVLSKAGAIFAPLLGELLAHKRAERSDNDRIAARERAATADAEIETRNAVDDIANEVRAADGGAGVRAVADSLRGRKSSGSDGAGDR